MTYTFYNTINGENRIRANVHRGVDPRTEKELWDAPIASVEDLDEAVAAAEKALKTWSRSTIEERKEVLTKMAEKLKEHAAEIEEIVKLETGKSVSYTPGANLSSSLGGNRMNSRSNKGLTSRHSWPISRLPTAQASVSTTVKKSSFSISQHFHISSLRTK